MTAGAEGKIKLWNFNSGKNVFTFHDTGNCNGLGFEYGRSVSEHGNVGE